MIRMANDNDAEQIAGIYNYYIENTPVTFEEESLSASDMAERIREKTEEGLPWFVMEEEGRIVGYAYASKWKGRCAYRFSVESTVYLSREHLGKGWGRQLYGELIKELKGRGYRTMIGGIALPNEKSQKLHEHFGFKKVAQFEGVGYKFEKWIDVGYWQFNL